MVTFLDPIVVGDNDDDVDDVKIHSARRQLLLNFAYFYEQITQCWRSMNSQLVLFLNQEVLRPTL